MKKYLSIILALVFAVSLFPAATLAAKIGDIVGYAQPTDIIATINGFKIESYNVNDYTYICVEDLRYYGFDVVYDNASRTLSFNRNAATSISPNTTNPKYHGIGSNSVRRPILYTDIVTYANGNYTPASNINGQTIINFNSLSQFGAVSYDNNKREISLIIDGLNINTSTSKPSISNSAASSSYSIIKNIAMSQGTLNAAGDYHIYEIYDTYGLMTSYSTSQDASTLFLTLDADDGVVGKILISFHEGVNPYILYELQGSNYEYSIFGQFLSAHAPFTVIENEFPTDELKQSAIESANSLLAVMDILSVISTGLSLNSLGIYYTK